MLVKLPSEGLFLRPAFCLRDLNIQELLDGDLSVRAFGLVAVCDAGVHQQRYGERTHQRLDVALLTFFQSFRKVYVGEHVMHTSKAGFQFRP